MDLKEELGYSWLYESVCSGRGRAGHDLAGLCQPAGQPVTSRAAPHALHTQVLTERWRLAVRIIDL